MTSGDTDSLLRRRRGRVVPLGRVTAPLGRTVIGLDQARRDASPKPDLSGRHCASEGRSLSDASVFLGCVMVSRPPPAAARHRGEARPAAVDLPWEPREPPDPGAERSGTA